MGTTQSMQSDISNNNIRKDIEELFKNTYDNTTYRHFTPLNKNELTTSSINIDTIIEQISMKGGANFTLNPDNIPNRNRFNSNKMVGGGEGDDEKDILTEEYKSILISFPELISLYNNIFEQKNKESISKIIEYSSDIKNKKEKIINETQSLSEAMKSFGNITIESYEERKKNTIIFMSYIENFINNTVFEDGTTDLGPYNHFNNIKILLLKAFKEINTNYRPDEIEKIRNDIITNTKESYDSLINAENIINNFVNDNTKIYDTDIEEVKKVKKLIIFYNNQIKEIKDNIILINNKIIEKIKENKKDYKDDLYDIESEKQKITNIYDIIIEYTEKLSGEKNDDSQYISILYNLLSDYAYLTEYQVETSISSLKMLIEYLNPSEDTEKKTISDAGAAASGEGGSMAGGSKDYNYVFNKIYNKKNDGSNDNKNTILNTELEELKESLLKEHMKGGGKRKKDISNEYETSSYNFQTSSIGGALTNDSTSSLNSSSSTNNSTSSVTVSDDSNSSSSSKSNNSDTTASEITSEIREILSNGIDHSIDRQMNKNNFIRNRPLYSSVNETSNSSQYYINSKKHKDRMN